MNSKIIILAFLFGFFSFESFASSAWIQRADFGNGAQSRHRGTALSIGNKGYMGLGHFNGAGPNIIFKDWWEYDPASNSWTQKADYNGNGTTGNYAVLVFGMDKFGFIGGGQVASNSSFHKYDPATNTWTPVTNSPTTPQNTYGFVIGDKGYYMSGNQVFEYNSTTDSWTTKNSAPFNIGIWNSFFTIDNKGYMIFGNQIWEYKPTIDSWTARAPFPGLANAASVGFSQNQKGYIVSGYSGSLSNVTSEVWEYNPGTNQWTQFADFYGTSRRFSAAFSIGNRCYMGLGTNGTNFNDLWEFDGLLGLKEMFDVNKFKAYPNPAVEFINFTSENLTDFKVIIYDINGTHILTEQTNSNSIKINRNSIKKGMYFYSIEYGGEIVYSNKFIFN